MNLKKIFLIIVLIGVFLMVPRQVNAKDKVTIYMFRGNTCHVCEGALDYINAHKEELGDNIELITYEVWKNSNNSELQELVADKLKVERDDTYGVPFIVIGEEYIKGYADASTFREMLSIANKYVGSSEYKDVVKEAVKELDKEVEEKSLEELFPVPNKVVTIIVYAIFGIACLGVLGLILFSQKK